MLASADWLRTVRDTALWSGPSDPAVQFTTLPLGSFLQPHAGSDQGRLLVYYPGDSATRQAGVAWVAAQDVAPSGPPPWIVASELDGDTAQPLPPGAPTAQHPGRPTPGHRPRSRRRRRRHRPAALRPRAARPRSPGQHHQDRHGHRHPRPRAVARHAGARHRRRLRHGRRRRLVDHGPVARPAAEHPHAARTACCCPAATTPPSSSPRSVAESRDQFIAWMNATWPPTSWASRTPTSSTRADWTPTATTRAPTTWRSWRGAPCATTSSAKSSPRPRSNRTA